MSATIIDFPQSRQARHAADPAGERLQRALAALEAALAAQRASVAEWRASLGALRETTQGLGQSLGALQSRLGDTAGTVDRLGQQARQLEAWADGVLAAPR